MIVAGSMPGIACAGAFASCHDRKYHRLIGPNAGNVFSQVGSAIQ